MEHLLPGGSGTDPFSDLTGDVTGDAGLGGPFSGGSGVVGALFLLVMALVGVAVVLSGVRQVVRSRRRTAEVRTWTTRGRTTTGTVVDNRMQSHRRTGPHAGAGWSTGTSLTFSPVVRFEADGREVTVAGDQVSNRSFITGRAAQVVYDPTDPERAHVVAEGGSSLGNQASGVLLIGVGVVFLLGLATIAGMASSVL